MSMNTCRWCGKKFDTIDGMRAGVSAFNTYCCKRCENAANRAAKAEAERSKAARKEASSKIKGVIKSLWK